MTPSSKLRSPFRHLMNAVVLTLIAVVYGCGPATFEYPEVTTPPPSKVDNFRELLKSYAESGQLDSGAELLVAEADSLSIEGVTKSVEIKTEVQQMVAAKSAGEVKKHAEAALKMLP
ncbi:MAG: hypothetical protein R3C49_19230 [Planctomycetaceae bacterium]